jgi:hypothetical protein
MKLVKAFFGNRWGLTLVAVNFLMAAWGVVEKRGDYQSFHYYYEPLPIKIIALVNLPAITLAEVVNAVFFSPVGDTFSMIWYSRFTMFLVAVFSSLQWLAIGFFLKKGLGEKLK